jgi:hypothetical protein
VNPPWSRKLRLSVESRSVDGDVDHWASSASREPAHIAGYERVEEFVGRRYVRPDDVRANARAVDRSRSRQTGPAPNLSQDRVAEPC